MNPLTEAPEPLRNVLPFSKNVYVVTVFDYPTEGKGGKTGFLAIDGVYSNEMDAEASVGELAKEHDEAWTEPFPLNCAESSILLTLEDGVVTIHVADPDIN